MFNIQKKQMKKGFTAFELLIVVAIMSVLAAVVLVPFMGFRDTKVLDTTADDIVSLLNEARQDTLLSRNGSQYGVYFETSRMVYFKGTTFTEPNADNKEVFFNQIVQLSDISLAGFSDSVVFERLTGKTSNSGSVTIQVASDTSREIVITIEPTGVVGF